MLLVFRMYNNIHIDISSNSFTRVIAQYGLNGGAFIQHCALPGNTVIQSEEFCTSNLKRSSFSINFSSISFREVRSCIARMIVEFRAAGMDLNPFIKRVLLPTVVKFWVISRSLKLVFFVCNDFNFSRNAEIFHDPPFNSYK